MEHLKLLMYDSKKSLKEFYEDLLTSYPYARPGVSEVFTTADICAQLLKSILLSIYTKVLNYSPNHTGEDTVDHYDSMMAGLVSANYIEVAATIDDSSPTLHGTAFQLNVAMAQQSQPTVLTSQAMLVDQSYYIYDRQLHNNGFNQQAAPADQMFYNNGFGNQNWKHAGRSNGGYNQMQNNFHKSMLLIHQQNPTMT